MTGERTKGDRVVSVRRATASDAPALSALTGELGYPAGATELAERMARLLPRADHAVLVAERSPGDVIGWLHVTDQETLEYGRRAEIVGLVVSGSTRRLGVGRQLVSAAETWARSCRLHQMFVRSNVVRNESHPFYESIGFGRVKTQHAYRKDL